MAENTAWALMDIIMKSGSPPMQERMEYLLKELHSARVVSELMTYAITPVRVFAWRTSVCLDEDRCGVWVVGVWRDRGREATRKSTLHMCALFVFCSVIL